ncbi:MAG: serine protease [Planctomycetota bacterium]
MTNRILLALAPVVAATAFGARSWIGSGTVDAIDLRPGEEREVVLVPGEAPPVFRVRVGGAATTLRLRTEGANADVTILGAYDRAPEDGDYSDFDVASIDDWIDDELVVNLTDAVPLEAGDWYFWTPLSEAQSWNVLGGVVRFRVRCEVVVPERTKLVLDEPTTVTVRRESGLLAAFECELPEELVRDDAPLRFEVFSDRADVDGVVGPRLPARTYWESFVDAESSRSFERVAFGAKECGRRFAVMAYAFPEFDEFDELELSVLVARDSSDAPTLCPQPRLPVVREREPLENALAATVQVVGPSGSGSGVVVSPRGHVLTNAHVVSGAALPTYAQGELVPLSVSFDLDGADSTAPTLGATLLEYDQERDVALLRIDSDLLRRPLPDDVRFPCFERRPADERPRVGEDVWCIGYPMTGGTHSFLTVSATRGVVSGSARDREGRKIKVDAAIHSGMSGGACVDARGRLLGLPSSSVTDSDRSGSLGYVIPLENVPEAWWRHLER